MFDIGVNLTSRQLLPDAAGLLERAAAAGIRGMAITGTSLTESRQALELCEQFHGRHGISLCATVGVHPHQASEWDEASAGTLLQLAAHPHARAIGETGLDFNRNYSTPEAQRRAFIAQLDLAAETGLPLFLHERDAFAQQIELLRTYRPVLSGAVAHCFTGTREQLHAYLDLDCYIGITGWICDERRGQPLAALAAEIPAERLLIETDAPWLLPRNMPSPPVDRRNEPAFLGWVLRKLAECRNEPAEELAARTATNARQFFRLPADAA